MEAPVGLGLLDLVTLEQDVEPYIMDWPVLATEEDGEPEVAALVVAKRDGGFLAAVPVGFIPEEVLAAGNAESPIGLVGPSTVLQIPGVIIEDGRLAPTGDPPDGRCSRSGRGRSCSDEAARSLGSLSLQLRCRSAFCNPLPSRTISCCSGVGSGRCREFSAALLLSRGRGGGSCRWNPRRRSRWTAVNTPPEKRGASSAWAREAFRRRKAAHCGLSCRFSGGAPQDECRPGSDSADHCRASARIREEVSSAVASEPDPSHRLAASLYQLQLQCHMPPWVP